MKYYKLINQQGWESYIKDKIYGDFAIRRYKDLSPEYWQEVSELEYNIQEGIILGDNIKIGCENLPIFQFKEWQELYNKEEIIMDKKIIGYITKENYKKYKSFIESIIGCGLASNWKVTILSCIKALEEAQLLNVWFEPVYEKEFKVGDWMIIIQDVPDKGKVFQLTDNFKSSIGYYGIRYNNNNWRYPTQVRKATQEEIDKSKFPQITINGYKAEFFDTYIKFGCAYIKKEDILRLNEIITEYHPGERDTSIIFRKIESVTIGNGVFSKEQIKEIAEYYLNK